jgi:beta-aspartyl-peptidase (threonine type)
MPLYVAIASSNGQGAMGEVAAVLRDGGSALDAVEFGCRLVESDPADHTVGLGGLPNLLGDVELDAAIMDGRTRATGGVAAVRGYEHPISIARGVMERTPHVLLAGEGAERFAAEMGFPRAELLTAEARRLWEQRLRAEAPELEPGLVRYHEEASRYLGLVRDPERAAGGTVNFIALDSRGDLTCGVSTSGWYFKYPGRVGDSPLVGAGLYADNRYGAAACTGRGELAIRGATAHSVVMHLSYGKSVAEAVSLALADADGLPDPYATGLNVLALDREGNHATASNRAGSSYIWVSDEVEAPQQAPRTLVGHAPQASPAPH